MVSGGRRAAGSLSNDGPASGTDGMGVAMVCSGLLMLKV